MDIKRFCFVRYQTVSFNMLFRYSARTTAKPKPSIMGFPNYQHYDGGPTSVLFTPGMNCDAENTLDVLKVLCRNPSLLQG